MDWADKLVAKKIRRGDDSVTAAELRKRVEDLCKENVERWREKWNNSLEKEAFRQKETKRLIKLEQTRDDRDQFKFDYKQRGIDIEPDYSQDGKIASVRLPFTSAEWADLLNKEGEHLPACCADISRIRDILQGACREDYHINTEDLEDAVFLAKHHGFKLGDDPIGKMIALWNKVKEDARDRRITSSTKVDDPEDALETLYQASGNICWDNIYSRNHDGKDRTFDRHMNRTYALATAQVAVRTLFFKMKELDPGAIEGYGLVRQDGEVGRTQSGLAVFRTEELAQEICDRWNKAELENFKDKRRKNRGKEPNTYTVKKIRVSMEKGFEILPDDHEVQITQDVQKCSEPPERITI